MDDLALSRVMTIAPSTPPRMKQAPGRIIPEPPRSRRITRSAVLFEVAFVFALLGCGPVSEGKQDAAGGSTGGTFGSGGSGSGGSGSGGSGSGGSGSGGSTGGESGGQSGSASGGAAGESSDARANRDSPTDEPGDGPDLADTGDGGYGGDTARDGGVMDGAGETGPDRSGSGGGGGSSGDGGARTVFPSGVTKPRITIVGDSISAGPGCYKKYLLMNLMANHYSRFEFVGEYADDCGGNVRHSAVSCSNTMQWSQPTFMMPNCSEGKTFAGMSTVAADVMPDLVMVQLGVNDVWGGTSTDAILGNYTKLVNQARARNSRVVVVVAQTHKIAPGASGCNDMSVYNRALALVNAVPAWAKSVTTSDSPVFTADLWTNSDQHQTLDCVHPDDAGARRMGLNWFNALAGILSPN